MKYKEDVKTDVSTTTVVDAPSKSSEEKIVPDGITAIHHARMQFIEMRKKHEDVLFLFRVGDFYEAYEENAVDASKILGITLTIRKEDGESYHMAGFPYHSLDTYLPKLIRAGLRVCIAEPLEEAKKNKKCCIDELVKSKKYR